MKTKEPSEGIILVSGGFDPVHVGHLRMFNEAKSLGTKLIVILNNDDFLIKKKGYFFMDQNERLEIISNFKSVDEVFLSVDDDLTVIKSIETLSQKNKIDIFCNGGDRKNIQDIPEYEICKSLGINLVFNSGGEKIQSSSDLTSNFLNKQNKFITVNNPGGKYTTYEHQSGYLLKRIEVNRGESLSLQSHEFGSEVWVVAQGRAKVNLEDSNYELKISETINIPVGAKHMLSNDSNEKLILVEIQLGDDLREDDIFRFKDKYGRG